MKKRNIRKTAAALTALALCAGVLTGCGGAASGTASSVAASSAASSEASSADADALAAQNVADLIDAIYVQQRTDDTDAQCEAAKAAWDALTDAQKELVEGENADPDYFGRDTGDASKDDARNADEIGENELLVVSFGTSFNDSRAADIKGIEDALQAAYPDWSVRRAFTAQIIIDVYKRQAHRRVPRGPAKACRVGRGNPCKAPGAERRQCAPDLAGRGRPCVRTGAGRCRCVQAGRSRPRRFCPLP